MRVDFGAKFEPKGNRILHGGGQDEIAFTKYIGAVGSTPASFSEYVSPHHQFFSFVGTFKSSLRLYEPYCVLPLLGMHMNWDESPDRTYYAEIANGSYDKKLTRYLNAVASIEAPIYLRIGFECNGQWNGYTDAELYIKAFRHVVELIRELGIDHIATVWCINPDANRTDYMSYYPGDEYVDWWAIDIFHPDSITSSVTASFFAEAEAHHKPVVLSECCPLAYSTNDTAVLAAWMQPFFRLIQQTPVIKGVYYINWNWPEKSISWNSWGDSRMETAHPDVLAYYTEQINHAQWLHAMTQDQLKELLHGTEALSVLE